MEIVYSCFMKGIRIIPFLLSLIFSALYLRSISDLPLGATYDALITFGPGILAPQDLVVIDTKDLGSAGLSSEDASRIVRILTAMDSRMVVFQTDVRIQDENQNFNSLDRQNILQKEFVRIQKNITNLFDGIRLGSIRPQDAERYVKDMNGLIEESKNRLLLTIAESGNKRELELEDAKALFKRVIVCDDILWGTMAGNSFEVWGGKAVYSRVEPDIDGNLRRMYPVRNLPNKQLIHAGAALLMDIMENPVIEQTADTLTLRSEKERYVIPLDSQGRMLLRHPETYQQVSVNDFKTYQELERKLYETLKEMERSGYFGQLDAMQYPTTLYEYASSLEQEALENPLPDSIQQWKDARQAFYKSARDLIQGPAEKTILEGYDSLLATEALQEGGKERIAALKELASQSFSWARKAYDELMVTHTQFESILRDAYCVIGSSSGDADATVALISTILSRAYIYPGKPFPLLIAMAGVLVFLSLMTFVLSPVWFFVFGLVFSLILFLLTSSWFIIAGYWYAPFISVVITLGATLLYELAQLIFVMYIRRHQELALKYRMSPVAFKELIHAIPLSGISSVPLPQDIQESEALILCVRHASFIGDRNTSTLMDLAQKLKRFRQRTGDVVRSSGGTVLWMDGEVLFAAFGFPSPPSMGTPEPTNGGGIEYCRKALIAVQRLVELFPDEPVSAGMDYGNSAFYFDILSGYSAVGRVAVHARALSGLATRYNTAALCTESVYTCIKEEIGTSLGATLIDSLLDQQENRKIRFYSIRYNGHSGS